MIRWTGLAPWEFETTFQVALYLPSQKHLVVVGKPDSLGKKGADWAAMDIFEMTFNNSVIVAACLAKQREK